MPEERLEQLRAKLDELSKAVDECRRKMGSHHKPRLGVNAKIKLLTASALIGVSVRFASALLAKFTR